MITPWELSEKGMMAFMKLARWMVRERGDGKVNDGSIGDAMEST